ncbi:hypothetical protein [Streptomyces sp. NPDC093097]|uniref:hypothetical protein n=1 Tax=Streptomyces sp. NPDC093097 TaxID=3366027 RepID=UPI0037F5AE60
MQLDLAPLDRPVGEQLRALQQLLYQGTDRLLGELQRRRIHEHLQQRATGMDAHPRVGDLHLHTVGTADRLDHVWTACRSRATAGG